MWRLRPSVIIGAAWALVTVLKVRRGLRRSGLEVPTPRPIRMWPGTKRGVYAVLHRLKPTCLERSLVAQAWLAGQGLSYDLVVGVPRAGFTEGEPAHAWLEGISDVGDKYLEIYRRRPVSVRQYEPRRITTHDG